MRLGTRIFFCYFLILVICFSYPVYWILENLITRSLERVEEPLVDQANILAAIVGREMKAGQFDPEKWYQAFEDACSRPLSSKIYNLIKTSVDTRIYMTDASGKVIFDSKERQNIGSDFTCWRDVRLTLEGKYGARTTADRKDDPNSKVKSPLSAIRGAAELLEEQMPPEQRARFLSNIRHEANRIQEIVDKMLELSALENRKIIQKMESISLSGLTKTVIESKQPLLTKKNLQLINLIPDDILVRGDSFLLSQAVANLIQNAIDFSPSHDQIF